MCVHVRHPAIPSERARASSVGKTPSFSLCQVDTLTGTLDVSRELFLTLKHTDCRAAKTKVYSTSAILKSVSSSGIHSVDISRVSGMWSPQLVWYWTGPSYS